MKCPNCENSIDENVENCEWCGINLKEFEDEKKAEAIRVEREKTEVENKVKELENARNEAKENAKKTFENSTEESILIETNHASTVSQKKSNLLQKKHYIILLSILIIIPLCFWMYYKYNSEQESNAYEYVMDENTIEACEVFLKHYPNSKYAQYVYDKINSLQEEQNQQKVFDLIANNMIYVQGGNFMMGTNDGDNEEKPKHKVTVSDFYIGKYEVTQAQWQAVMGTTIQNYIDLGYSNRNGWGKGDNYPMYCVSWNDAQEFISKLNALTGKQYRLPTEAEWEFAALGGNNSSGYKYSGSNDLSDVAWYYKNSGDKIIDEWDVNLDETNNNSTHPVGAKSPNELGIYDMSGNVLEWCNDWFGNYSNGAQNNPQGPSFGSYRVARGGYWGDYLWTCRVTFRNNNKPDVRAGGYGFRLVLDR